MIHTLLVLFVITAIALSKARVKTKEHNEKLAIKRSQSASNLSRNRNKSTK